MTQPLMRAAIADEAESLPAAPSKAAHNYYDRHNPRQAIWLIIFWIVSRAIMVSVFSALMFSPVTADINYYSGAPLRAPIPIFSDLANVLPEYPTPLVWFVQGVGLIAGGSHSLLSAEPGSFVSAYIVVLCLLDGIACLCLFTRESPKAAWAWAFSGFIFGPMLWGRLDLIPALAVLAGMHWMKRRPALAGAMIALGAGLKLWPAMLIVPLLGFSKREKRGGAGFLITGIFLAGLSLLTQGWARTVSPLTYQSDRGLQIESVWATVPMVMRAVNPHSGLNIFYSQYKAFEITGNSSIIHFWLLISDVSFIIVLVAILIFCWLVPLRGIKLKNHPLNFSQLRALISVDGDSARQQLSKPLMWTISFSMLAIVSSVIVANKTLSPQYLPWLFPPLVFVFIQANSPRRKTIAYPALAIGMLAIALTPLIYPLGYGGFFGASPNAGAIALLVLRNSALVILTIYAWYQSFRLAIRTGILNKAKPDEVFPL